MENLLEIKSLNTYYGESHILRDVDLNVKSGEMVCLIGRREHKIARLGVGRKFQSPRIFENLTVKENLLELGRDRK